MDSKEPGAIITPQTQSETPNTTAQTGDSMSAKEVTNIASTQPVFPQPTKDQGSPEPSADNQGSSFYHPENQQTASQSETEPQLAWEADEFVAAEKRVVWYVMMIAGAALFSGFVYWLNRDIMTSVIILVALSGFAFFSARKPQKQQYLVGPDGIQVGRMYYSFSDFRSFAVVTEKTGHSLVLVSLKRFVPAINIYIPQEYEDEVVKLVSSILPMEQYKPDLTESIANRLHF